MRTTSVLLALVSMLAAAPVAAQVQVPPEPAGGPIGSFIASEKAKADAAAGATDPLPTLPDLASLQRLDPETRSAALEALREYYRYRQSGYQHRRRVFDWQLLSSRIIFVIVILMVSAGIYFSGVQFHLALRGAPPVVKEIKEAPAAIPSSADTAPAEAPRPAPMTLQTSFEAGSSGVKVSSPVLGVIILVISFLFFYMYLVHVYPISEIM